MGRELENSDSFDLVSHVRLDEIFLYQILFPLILNEFMCFWLALASIFPMLFIESIEIYQNG